MGFIVSTFADLTNSPCQGEIRDRQRENDARIKIVSKNKGIVEWEITAAPKKQQQNTNEEKHLNVKIKYKCSALSNFSKDRKKLYTPAREIWSKGIGKTLQAAERGRQSHIHR